jgi:hypothetical protein
MAMLRHFWDGVVEEDPAARAKDEGVRFPLCAPGALESAFEIAGLPDVATRPIDATDRFADFEEYWTPLSERRSARARLPRVPAGRASRKAARNGSQPPSDRD